MSAAPEPVAELAAIDRKRKGLKVRFFRIGDRYQHVIEGVVGERATPLLESLEGDVEHDWPPSPPLQHLQIRPMNASPVVLMTGAAGTNHWSISVSAEQYFPGDEFDDEIQQLVTIGTEAYLSFDVACRLKTPPIWLGSSYKVIRGIPSDTLGSLVFADGCIIVPHSKLRFPKRPFDPFDGIVKLTHADAGRKLVQIASNGSQNLEPPVTARWKYAMFWGMT